MATQEIMAFGPICKDRKTNDKIDPNNLFPPITDEIKYSAFKVSGTVHYSVAYTDKSILIGIKRLTKTIKGKNIILYSEFALSKESANGIAEIIKLWTTNKL